ncbi:unnamed protein product [Candidula unifasciata]|uniref:Glutathione transferase n=1 Tax=Candidula unifasciata TaxID=100452 RepID=A0A8S3YMM8_9EUPU|nr:unnamed protein product [Candidula unifasciata]
MANAELTLYYFDTKGRAEVARLILAAAGKEFTDIRFSLENWPEYKILAPFGQCPFIKVDDKIFAQSLAINLFLAREFGFYGETNLEALEIDQITQLVEDLVSCCLDAIHMDNGEEKKKEIEKIKVNKSPKFLENFEKLLKENGTGFFVGDRLTLADIAVFDVITGMLKGYVDVNDNFPLLLKHVELVKAHSKIGPYVTSRPDTEL